ncbi:MAG: hypothetical protein KGM43_14720, partial [Planctomycetota bacterium]|nr:hypothetical protein [Planctomycetota bacterium]
PPPSAPPRAVPPRFLDDDDDAPYEVAPADPSVGTAEKSDFLDASQLGGGSRTIEDPSALPPLPRPGFNVDAPALPQRVAPTSKKKTPAQPDREPGDNLAADTFVQVVAGIFGVVALGSLVYDLWIAGFPTSFWRTTGLVAGLLFWIGAIWTMVAAFRESMTQGLLCLVPFYGFYYLATRWQAVKRQGVLIVVAFGLAVINSSTLRPLEAARVQAVLEKRREELGVPLEIPDELVFILVVTDVNDAPTHDFVVRHANSIVKGSSKYTFTNMKQDGTTIRFATYEVNEPASSVAARVDYGDVVSARGHTLVVRAHPVAAQSNP